MKPINLNQVGKVRDRALQKKQADVNAAKFGMTKAQRVLAAAQTKQTSDRLSQHQFEDE